jgi:hypothetical protein
MISACEQLDPEFVGKIDQVAPCIPITLRKLIDKMFDAGRQFRKRSFRVALTQRDISA